MNGHGTSSWTLASTMVVERRTSSFGGRDSEYGSLHQFCWDPISKAFEKGDKHDLVMGRWSFKSYPCDPDLAEAILLLCADEEVQSTFFKPVYDTEGYSCTYLCGEHLVALHRHGAYERSDGRYVHLSSFSFQFYGPDLKVQRVSLMPDLSQTFSSRIMAMKPETIHDKVHATAVAA